MNKELVLFKQIIKGYTEMFNMAIHHPKDTIVKWEGVEEIENALKDYERYKPLIENIQNGLASAIAFEDLKVLMTRSKTLEIIKNKQVAVDEFIRCCKKENNPLEEYNNFAGDKNSLTQQEYDLLKEVLL